ncbi:MAG: NFACT family protein [Acutalibacteraceae bacterium]
MALDGIFLSGLKAEIEENSLYSRVDKVSMPTKDEIILSLRGRNGAKKLLLCIRSNSPRIHYITENIENPPSPPMICMLLRKYLTGAMITGLRQLETDRVLFIDFDATNKIGDKIRLYICFEIMGTYSNVILLDEEMKIIDSLRRIDFSASSVRQILPGLKYTFPAKQDKLNLGDTDAKTVTKAIEEKENMLLSKAVMAKVQGISPIVSREVAFLSCSGDKYVCETDTNEILKLENAIEQIKGFVSRNGKAYMLTDSKGKPFDFSFMPIHQYGSEMKLIEFDSQSEMLQSFYCEKDKADRNRQRGHELFHLVNNNIERVSKKLNLQREDLKKCADREKYRINAELINAYIYKLEKGSFYYDVENYYDNNKVLRIPCDPSLSPQKNAQKYFKLYKKAVKAEEMLTELIEKGNQELMYLHSVIDELSRCETDAEVNQIREELIEAGYIRQKNIKGNKKFSKALPPHEFLTSDGFTVLVGRNNTQNDKLSMKQANNRDMFLHVQKQPGSHVIIVSDNREITDKAIEEAAVIAAFYSSAAESSLVTVDYTPVKNLKKPVGAKAGFVIYHTYNSINVKPDKEAVERMKVK